MKKFVILIFGSVLVISTAFGQSTAVSNNVKWQTKQDKIDDIKFSPNGKYIFLDKGGKNGGIDVLDAFSGRTITHLAVCDFFFYFSTTLDGNLLATHCDKQGGKTSEIWDVPNARLLRTISHGSAGIFRNTQISPDGRRLLTESMSDRVDRPEAKYFMARGFSFYLWDGTNGKKMKMLAPKSFEPTESSTAAVFSPDSKLVITTYGGRVSVWDADTGSLLHDLIDPIVGYKYTSQIYAHGSDVLRFGFTHDGTKLITVGYRDGLLKIWDISSGVLEHTLRGHRERILNLDISPDGKMIGSVDRDNVIKIWDLQSGILVRSIESKKAVDVRFTSDSKYVFGISSGLSIMFDVSSGMEVSLVDHGWIYVSPDRKWILTYQRKERMLQLSPSPY